MSSFRPLTPAARLRLEAALLARWGAKHADQCLRQLRPWSGWRWPLEAELREAIPWMSKPARARRLREAREALPAMMRLPTLTPEQEVSLLRHRIDFGVLPRSALVLPEDRQLGPWHALAIVGRGLPMTMAVSRAVGGTWLRPTVDAERERREDEEAVALLKAEAEQRRAARSPGGGGMQAVFFRF